MHQALSYLKPPWCGSARHWVTLQFIGGHFSFIIISLVKKFFSSCLGSYVIRRLNETLVNCCRTSVLVHCHTVKPDGKGITLKWPTLQKHCKKLLNNLLAVPSSNLLAKSSVLRNHFAHNFKHVPYQSNIVLY